MCRSRRLVAFLIESMENLLERYRNLPKKYQYGILVGAFVLGILILPSTIVWAAATVAAYKLITKKVWRYLAVSILALFTFFAGVLWIAGDTVPEESAAPIEEAAQVQEPIQTEVVSEEPQSIEEPVVEESKVVEEARSEPAPVAAPQQSVAPAQASAPVQSEPAPTPAAAASTGGAWYTSSHFSAKYYYHASCDGWQGLSPTYLQSYSTEAALRAAHPNHTRHPECNP